MITYSGHVEIISFQVRLCHSSGEPISYSDSSLQYVTVIHMNHTQTSPIITKLQPEVF